MDKKENKREEGNKLPNSLYELVKQIAIFVDKVDKENIDKSKK